MTPLEKALRAKFNKPEDVLRKLGMDENLLVQQQKEKPMKVYRGVPISKTACARIIASCAKPVLAQDESLTAVQVAPLLKDVNAANFGAKRKGIGRGLAKLLRGKLAADQASPDDVALRLLDIIHGPESAEGAEAATAPTDSGSTGEGSDQEEPVLEEIANEVAGEEEEEELPPPGPDQALTDTICNFLQEKGVSPEICEELKGLIESGGVGGDQSLEEEKDLPIGDEDEEDKTAEDQEEDDKEKTAQDQPPDFEGKPQMPAKDSKMAKDSKPHKQRAFVTKMAMDAAIQSAVKKAREDEKNTRHAIREAERIVRPYVGDLAVACDSAEQVYGAALRALKINTKGVHPSAFRTILELQPKPGVQQKSVQQPVAMDSKASKSYAERFPSASRLRVI